MRAKTLSIVAVMILGLLLFLTAAAKAATTGQANAQAKLTEVKLKVCQNKEASIQKRSTQLVKMAENMETVFDQIATRVEQYYTAKVVPSGKTVTNYDALVADIAAKKKVAQTDLDKATADAKAFSCASDDPKGQLTLFRTDMQQVKQDLKAYRTAIKNLIVAVHSITGTTEGSQNE